MRPRHVTDTSAQASVGVHLAYAHIPTKIRPYKLTGFLMGEVGSQEGVFCLDY
ncbi:MAG: hypothetical protein ACYCXP_02295 [Leptospirillum sp.]